MTTEQQGWESYWRDTSAEFAVDPDSAAAAAISDFWISSFQPLGPDAACLDIASGSGAVIQHAVDYFGAQSPSLTGQDMSAAAIEQLTLRFPNVVGIVSDARKIPQPDQSFDLVTSQFGIEYAKPKAFAEAARLVKGGGRLALVVHCKPGLIFNECAANLAAVEKLRAARFFPLASAFLSAGFKAAHGGNQRAYEKAHKQFKPAFRTLERTITKYGPSVASGLPSRLATDIATINRRLQNYDRTEVLAWLSRLEGELDEYRDRMRSMVNAALSNKELDKLRQELFTMGFSDIDPSDDSPDELNQRVAIALHFRRS